MRINENVLQNETPEIENEVKEVIEETKRKREKRKLSDNLQQQEAEFKEKTGVEFKDFYKKYHPKLIYFINNFVKDEEIARDVTSEAFIAALDQIEKYNKEKAYFSTWLFVIARNLALQEIEKNKKTTSLDVEIDEEGATLKDFLCQTEVDKHDSEDFHVLIDKKAFVMKTAIQKLAKPYQEIIMMREIENMSYKEIADNLNLNLNTTKSRIKMARALLCKMVRYDFKKLEQLYV